jgi:hypothetical protein
MKGHVLCDSDLSSRAARALLYCSCCIVTTECKRDAMVQKDILNTLQQRLHTHRTVDDFKKTFTGLAVLDDTTVAVTSDKHLMTLRFAARWSIDVPWPQAFRRAAATVLLIVRFGQAHAATTARGALNLWSLPADVVSLLLEKMAGERCDWLHGGDEGDSEGGLAGAYHGLLDEELTHELIQKPLCQLWYDRNAVLLQPAHRPPLSYLD